MAGPRGRRSPCRNLLPAGEDELAGAAPSEGNSTPTSTPAVSLASIPGPAIALSLNNMLFKQFMKAYLKA